MADWDYKNSRSWGEKVEYRKCNLNNQSPINIDTSNLEDEKNKCGSQDCKLKVNYISSKCHVVVKNRSPTIYFDHGSYIVYNGFKGEDDNYNFISNKFYLKKMTLHTPSMHTINNNSYDMEAILYHYNNSDEINENESGGIAISLLFKSGNDKGNVNRFFNQIINQIPLEEKDQETFIDVDDNWNANMLLPTNKAFFTYPGSLPHPPCNENWYWIVFDL